MSFLVHHIPVDDNFAEAFPMTATRIIVTACNERWVRHATTAMCGFATSVIACVVEAGVDRFLDPHETPDGRPGAAVLLFGMRKEQVAKQLLLRVGQCVLTCPTTAVFAGLATEERIPLGSRLRQFGDGYQISKRIQKQRFWRIPVMDGDFVCEHDTGVCKAVGGGNFILLAENVAAAIHAVESAVAAMEQVPDTITPFPGGVARSGSKVGSKYKALMASTNSAFCPTLRHLTPSLLPDGAGAALEIVIDGLTENAVRQSMRVGIEAACRAGRGHGLLGITGGNYGGKLGKYHFHLREVLG